MGVEERPTASPAGAASRRAMHPAPSTQQWGGRAAAGWAFKAGPAPGPETNSTCGHTCRRGHHPLPQQRLAAFNNHAARQGLHVCAGGVGRSGVARSGELACRAVQQLDVAARVGGTLPCAAHNGPHNGRYTHEGRAKLHPPQKHAGRGGSTVRLHAAGMRRQQVGGAPCSHAMKWACKSAICRSVSPAARSPACAARSCSRPTSALLRGRRGRAAAWHVGWGQRRHEGEQPGQLGLSKHEATRAQIHSGRGHSRLG